MARSVPTREVIATQLREFSKARGVPVTERQWRTHPERLCGSTTIRRLFQQSWNDVLRTCGVTPRDTNSPEYVVHWILAFYAQWQRWPQGRDFKRPCGYSVVRNVFRDCNNSVAAAVQLAQDTLKTLTVEGIVLTEYLANHFTTVTPQALPSTSTIIAPGASTGRSAGGSGGTERTDEAPG